MPNDDLRTSFTYSGVRNRSQNPSKPRIAPCHPANETSDIERRGSKFALPQIHSAVGLGTSNDQVCARASDWHSRPSRWIFLSNRFLGAMSDLWIGDVGIRVTNFEKSI